MKEQSVYIRMRHRVQVHPNQQVKIGDVAQVISTDEIETQLKDIPVHKIQESDKNIVIIDLMKVIRLIQNKYPSIDVQSIGGAETIVRVLIEKRKLPEVYFLLIWLLLFIGAGLAVMNFHEDVSMLEVHHQIFTIITGREIEKPLLLQIPYSIGLGLGMILFFNHVFKKRLNEEPSPLEVEMFNYQQDLDRYLVIHENAESEKKLK